MVIIYCFFPYYFHVFFPFNHRFIIDSIWKPRITLILTNGYVILHIFNTSPHRVSPKKKILPFVTAENHDISYHMSYSTQFYIFSSHNTVHISSYIIFISWHKSFILLGCKHFDNVVQLIYMHLKTAVNCHLLNIRRSK